MDSKNFYLFMNIFIFAFTIYAGYTYYMLKYKHTIIPTMLMSKMDSSKRCKDLDAYSKFMLPQLILLIAIMLLNMIVFVIHFYIVSINPVFIAMIIVFMGELAWYSYKINKSMKFFDK